LKLWEGGEGRRDGLQNRWTWGRLEEFYPIARLPRPGALQYYSRQWCLAGC